MSAPKFHGYTADFGNATLFNEPFGKKVWVICFIDISEDTLSVRTERHSQSDLFHLGARTAL